MVEIEFYRETRIVNTTTGVSMAVKKTLMDGYTYQDMFDTQDALDSGDLKQVQAGTKTWSAQQSFLGIKGSKAGGTGAWMADASTLGSILGQTDAIAAYKKRKLEQQKMAQAGVGSQQSILGGGAF